MSYADRVKTGHFSFHERLENEGLSLVGQVLSSQKNRLFLWSPVCFGLGIALYFSLKFEPPLLPVFIAAVFFLTGWIYFWRTHEQGIGHEVLRLILGGFFLIASGVLVSQIRTVQVDTPQLVKAVGPVSVEGRIEKIDILGPKDGSRVVLSDLKIEKLATENTPRKIRLRVRKDDEIRPGYRVRLLARLNPPSPPVAPSAFDFRKYAYFRSIGAVGFAYDAPEILEQAPARFDRVILYKIETLRQSIVRRVEAHVDYPQASVTATLLTGQRGTILDEDTDAMRASGLAHLLAISGMHIGMVAGVIFFSARLMMALWPWLALHYPIKKIAAVIALIGAFIYMLMAGATVPTQRAMLMTGLALVAILLDRSPFSLRLVALAAFSILIISPESLMGASFQMSFAAVTALICFYEAIRPHWSAWHRRAGFLRRAGLYLAGVLMTTVIAGFATAPFALYHFQNFALYGVIANMLAVPLMASVVMPMAVLSFLAMPFGLEAWPLAVMAWGTSTILSIAHWTANLDGALLLWPVWPKAAFGLIVGAGLFLCLWQGWGRLLCLMPVIIAIVLIGWTQQPDMQISGRGELVALRDEDGKLWLSNRTKDRYVAENWLRRNGQDEQDKRAWPREGTLETLAMTCGEQGCRSEVKEKRLSFPRAESVVAEECLWADILIAPFPVRERNCKAKTVIDLMDLRYKGSHALWLDKNDSVQIKTVKIESGRRPWSGFSQ